LRDTNLVPVDVSGIGIDSNLSRLLGQSRCYDNSSFFRDEIFYGGRRAEYQPALRHKSLSCHCRKLSALGILDQYQRYIEDQHMIGDYIITG
jgi:hypothetical protein